MDTGILDFLADVSASADSEATRFGIMDLSRTRMRWSICPGAYEPFTRERAPRLDKRARDCVMLMSWVVKSPRLDKCLTSANSAYRPIQQENLVSSHLPTPSRLSVQRTFGVVDFSREKDGSGPATWGERLEGDDPSRVHPVGESGHVRRIDPSAPVDRAPEELRAYRCGVHRADLGPWGYSVSEPHRNLERLSQTLRELLISFKGFSHGNEALQ